MCFGGKQPKLPKAQKTPQLQVPTAATAPIQNQTPQIQTGADVANAQQASANTVNSPTTGQPIARKRSIFQVDLTIPTGANVSGGGASSGGPNGVGAAH